MLKSLAKEIFLAFALAVRFQSNPYTVDPLSHSDFFNTLKLLVHIRDKGLAYLHETRFSWALNPKFFLPCEMCVDFALQDLHFKSQADS